jgi:hypothetical protein
MELIKVLAEQQASFKQQGRRNSRKTNELNFLGLYLIKPSA